MVCRGWGFAGRPTALAARPSPEGHGCPTGPVAGQQAVGRRRENVWGQCSTICPFRAGWKPWDLHCNHKVSDWPGPVGVRC